MHTICGYCDDTTGQPDFVVGRHDYTTDGQVWVDLKFKCGSCGTVKAERRVYLDCLPVSGEIALGVESAKFPHHVRWDRKDGARPGTCECEHAYHFAEDAGAVPPSRHAYGIARPSVLAVKTEGGTFKLCARCRATCHAPRVQCPECREPIENGIKTVTASDGAVFHGRCWSNYTGRDGDEGVPETAGYRNRWE